MNAISKKNQIDMTTGSIMGKQIRFIIPLIFTGQLQLLYNAVDVIVVGKFAGTTALSAVGSTGALINLFLNVFFGLSVGTSVVTALYFGSKDEENIHKTIHTSITIAIVAGVFLAIIGFFMAPIMLGLMGTPNDVIDQAILYLRIYFMGMPFNLLYNFGASILRAIGDTKKPLVFLSISGIVNVVLNLVFVIGLNLDVAGVALATIIAQAMSTAFVLHYLMHSEGAMKLSLRKLHIYKEQLIKIVQIGLPAGIQGSFFSLSNVLIQSSINSFGTAAIAGSAAASNLEGFIYTAMNSVHQSAVTFAGQNIGAREYQRVRKNLYYGFGLVIIIGLIMSSLILTFDTQLIGLYTNDTVAISEGVLRIKYICTAYFLCGMMDVMTGHVRGIGHSFIPMLITLMGVCVFRVVWIFVVFARWPSLEVLYISYPVTWVLSLVGTFVYYQWFAKKEIMG